MRRLSSEEVRPHVFTRPNDEGSAFTLIFCLQSRGAGFPGARVVLRSFYVAQVGRVFCGRPEAFRCFSQGRFYVSLSLPVFVGAGFRPAILPFRVPQPSFLRLGPHRVLAPRTNNETAVIPRKFARMSSCGRTTRGPQRALPLRPLGWGEGSAFSWFLRVPHPAKGCFYEWVLRRRSGQPRCY